MFGAFVNIRVRKYAGIGDTSLRTRFYSEVGNSRSLEEITITITIIFINTDIRKMVSIRSHIGASISSRDH
jgi:hypothetical protein